MSPSTAVLAALVVATGIAPPPPHAEVTTRYHLGAKLEQIVDASALGGPSSQVTNQALDAWIVMTLADTAGGRTIHVLLDSVRLVTNNPAFDPGLQAAAKGATIHGVLDPQGRVKNLTSSLPTNPVVTGVVGAVNGLFPRVRRGVKNGESWTDTSDVANPGAGNNTTMKVVTTYTAGAAESVGGLEGMRVGAKSTSTISGTLSNTAGTLEVEGTGSGTGSFVVAGDGRFLGGSVNSTQDLKLKIAMPPASLPVKIAQSLTVTLVK
jgi:hypothetical protein